MHMHMHTRLKAAGLEASVNLYTPLHPLAALHPLIRLKAAGLEASVNLYTIHSLGNAAELSASYGGVEVLHTP